MVDRHLRVTGRAGAVTEGQGRVRGAGRERQGESDRKAGCITARLGMACRGC